jgi:hypothetical protein
MTKARPLTAVCFTSRPKQGFINHHAKDLAGGNTFRFKSRA